MRPIIRRGHSTAFGQHYAQRISCAQLRTKQSVAARHSAADYHDGGGGGRGSGRAAAARVNKELRSMAMPATPHFYKRLRWRAILRSSLFANLIASIALFIYFCFYL